MNSYEKNLSLLKKAGEQVYNQLKNEKPVFEINLNIVEEKHMFVQTCHSKCFVHSVYDIDREMQELFRDIKEDTTTLILYGFGSGYALEYIKRNYANIKNILIVEPFLELFKETLKYVDLGLLLHGFNKVSFVLNHPIETIGEYVVKVFNTFTDTDINIAALLTYRSLLPGYYEKVYDYFLQQLRMMRVNNITATINTEQWVTNMVKNFMLDKEIFRYNQMKTIAQNVDTAVLISAGSSLNKNMHLINQLKERAVVIAVGSAIKILSKNEIVPHFRMAVDGQSVGVDIFEGLEASAAPLLFSNMLYYEIPRDYNGKLLRLTIDGETLTEYLYQNTDQELTILDRGFSVANIALNMMCNLGFKKVVMLGQNLSFTKESYYAKGMDRKHEGNLSSENILELEDIYGEKVYSNKALYAIKEVFEKTIAKYPHIEYINATEGGLKISGTEDQSLEQVIRSLPINGYLQSGNELLRKTSSPNINYRLDSGKIVAQMSREVKKISEIIQTYSNRLGINKDGEGNDGNQQYQNYINLYKQYIGDLENLKLYHSLCKLLFPFFDAIRFSYNYIGEDKARKAESLYNMMRQELSLVNHYIQLLDALVNENEIANRDK